MASQSILLQFEEWGINLVANKKKGTQKRERFYKKKWRWGRSGRKVSLRMRLMLSYGFMALFLVLSLLIISNIMLEHHFKVYVQQRQEEENQNLVATVLDAFETQGEPSFEFFKQLGKEALKQGIVFMIKDENDKELYCESCSNVSGCEEMHKNMQEMMQKRYSNWEGQYTEKVYPLQKENTFYGSVVLGYYGPFFFHKEDLQFISLVNFVFGLVAVILLLVAFLMGSFLADRIAKPLQVVIERTKQLEQQQYVGRIESVSNTKELDQLIKSVNTLGDTLEQQQRVKKMMARDYAHEFRTPLAALQSNLEAMIDGIFDPTKERLESCLTEVLRLSRMSGQIHRIVELENQRVFIQKESFDFTQLLRQTVSVLEQEWREKKLKVTVSGKPCEIFADRDQMSQVIMNLLSNAIKYTKENGEIIAKVEERAHQLIFTLQDTGVGMPEEELENIFEYLYRIDNSRTKNTGGSGIGLAVVKSIVIAHGGTIEAKSQLGKGSTFIVRLPKK